MHHRAAEHAPEPHTMLSSCKRLRNTTALQRERENALSRFGNRELQQNSLFQIWVGAHRVGASELKGLESLGVGAPKCKTIALEKQSWCSGGWSLTKVQVGAWKLIATSYILYLFHCIVCVNKSIYFSYLFFVSIYIYIYMEHKNR